MTRTQRVFVMRALPVIGVVLAVLGCTSPRAVAPVEGGETQELRLKAGDSIRVVTKDRERLSLEITEIRGSELAGITVKPAEHETRAEGEPVVVRYDDLAFIVVERFSPARTAMAPVAVLAIAAGVVIEVGGFVPAAATP